MPTHYSIGLALSLVLAGCMGSGLEPLDPGLELARATSSRGSIASSRAAVSQMNLLPGPSWRQGPEIFDALLDRLLASNPDIREARAALLGASGMARTGSPWGDPSIGVGPLASTGGAPGAGWFASVSVSLPIGGRAGRESALLAEEARAAEVSLRAVSAERALDLRMALLRAMNSTRALETASENMEWARKGTALTRRAVEAGMASVVDLQLAVAEERAAYLSLLEVQDQRDDDLAGLSSLLSLATGALPPIPALPSDFRGPAEIDRSAVVSAMIAGSPELARRSAAFRVADRKLAAERSRSIPDLEVGFEAEGAPGEGGATVGVPFGFTLPLFDGNAAAVAQARAEALVAREAYGTEMDRLLSVLDVQESKVARLRERLRVMDEELLPEHAAALRSAAKAMEQTGFEALRYIEMQRTSREWKLEREGIMRELLETVVDLERVAGVPLFTLPGGR